MSALSSMETSLGDLDVEETASLVKTAISQLPKEVVLQTVDEALDQTDKDELVERWSGGEVEWGLV